MSGGRLDDKVALRFVEQFYDRFDHEQTRRKIIAVVQEQMRMRASIQLIKEYAAEEMDRRIFRSVRYWVTVIRSASISAFIGMLIAYIQ